MKDSQPGAAVQMAFLSISRRIMKDSQQDAGFLSTLIKYIKANNERFSTRSVGRPVMKILNKY